MGAEKLHRIENLAWFPLTIQFDIERHGAQPFGLILAAVHRRTIDVQSREAGHSHLKKRQIRPGGKPLDEDSYQRLRANSDEGCGQENAGRLA
jgi:hypothetical protein